MGMDLSGSGGYFRWTASAWYDILAIAEKFGWAPTGTGPPRGVLKVDWAEGSYVGNQGQRFYARDARAMADALERALVTFSESKRGKITRHARSFDKLAASLKGQRSPKNSVAVRLFESREAIRNIRKFIVFCRAGSFRIH